jgi:hypothetical protein
MAKSLIVDSKFCKMVEGIKEECSIVRKNFKRLKTLEPNPKSFEFAKWTSEIYLCCDEFYPDFDPKDPPDFSFAKNEEQFRATVANIMPQIQECL